MAEEEVVEEVKVETKVMTFEESMNDKSFKSAFDKAVQSGIETYKTGSFQDAVGKAVADKAEAEKHKTPEQLEMIEMKNTMKNMQSELAAKDLKAVRSTNESIVLKGLTDKGLPSGLSTYIVADTEESTLKNLESITGVITDYLQDIKTEKIKNNNIKVPSKEGVSTDGIVMPGPTASAEEWEEYFKNKGK